MGEARNERTVFCPQVLREHISERLPPAVENVSLFPHAISRKTNLSAVLFLLGNRCGGAGGAATQEPCVILNKRSSLVKQAGDLCFPGGGVSHRLDRVLAGCLKAPFSPLTLWPSWPRWRRTRPGDARRLAVLLATALREGLEEMRLNPLGVRLLGPLPAQDLVMFDRVIYPMAAWVRRQGRFFPNWEVEKIVRIPIRSLLSGEHYAVYRVSMNTSPLGAVNQEPRDFPCYLHREEGEEDLLWGATYRIVVRFLEIVFGFSPPDQASLPVVRGTLDGPYFEGGT